MRLLPFTLLLSLTSALVAFQASAETALTKPEDLSKMKELYKRPKEIPTPADNPHTQEKIELGKMLYFDSRLSRSKITSCATCHNPSFHWGDGLAKGVGDRHQILGRKTPTILNLAWDELFFWDGRASSLEEQALGPIESAAEMNMPHNEMLTILRGIPGYKTHFTKAFPGDADPINKANIGKAIAAFERTVVSHIAPFDRWIEGEEGAISDSAKRGFALFNTKANCASCHSSWRFSDGSFHDIGLPDGDLGRGKILNFTAMQHAFKTVGLRNIVERAPYMHDGSLKTLEDVIEHYDNKFVKRPSLSSQMKPLHLTASEKKDLVEFLKTLSSADAPITLPALPH